METKPIYISLVLILIFGSFLIMIINTFTPDTPPEQLALGSSFLSAMLGNEFNILTGYVDEDSFEDQVLEAIQENNLDIDFIFNFKQNFPNYIDMNELKNGLKQGELRFIPESIIVNDSEIIVFRNYFNENEVYVPQPTNFGFKFSCALIRACVSVENFAFVKIIDVRTQSGFLRNVNPFKLLLSEELRNEIDRYILSMGHVPRAVSTPLMLIISLGFSLTLIAIAISIISLIPFVGS